MVRRTCKVSCSVGDSIFSSLPNSKPNRVFVFPLVAFFEIKNEIRASKNLVASQPNHFHWHSFRPIPTLTRIANRDRPGCKYSYIFVKQELQNQGNETSFCPLEAVIEHCKKKKKDNRTNEIDLRSLKLLSTSFYHAERQRSKAT